MQRAGPGVGHAVDPWRHVTSYSVAMANPRRTWTLRGESEPTQEEPVRPLIVTAFVSLDGVMEAPGGEPGYRNVGWTL